MFEWVKGTALRPYLTTLDPDLAADFEARCRQALAAAYPPEPDGTTVFPFRRLFLLARV